MPRHCRPAPHAAAAPLPGQVPLFVQHLWHAARDPSRGACTVLPSDCCLSQPPPKASSSPVM